MMVTFSTTKPPVESAMPYEHCRAKTCPDGSPGTTVFDHCRYAGMMGKHLVKLLHNSVTAKLPLNAWLYVALHDIGKVSPGFQGKYFISLLEAEDKIGSNRYRNGHTNTNHAEVGAAAYEKLYGLTSDNPISKAIAGHHGWDTPYIKPNNDGPKWQQERIRLLHALEKELGVEVDAVSSASCDARMLTGLTCVSDWLASDESIFPPQEASLSQEDLSKRVKRTLAMVGFRPIAFHRGLSFSDVFKDKDGIGYKARGEQQSLINAIDRPGVYVMEASMGAGKTEAALFAAYRMIEAGYNNGIYFALPTRLTSDRIYKRAQEWLNIVNAHEAPIRLSHGRAWLEGFSVGAEGSRRQSLPPWFSPAKRALLYPFSVGTIDQALLAVMRVKHSSVRLFGLAGKVVILDEVHSYDMYTGSLVDELVNQLRELGCTVIILSATLTRAKRRALMQTQSSCDDMRYPLVTSVKDGKIDTIAPQTDTQEKHIKLERLHGLQAIVESAIAHAKAGCNVLCVANTVRQAQTWFCALKAKMNESEAQSIRLGLLHSRYPAYRRDEIENEWMDLLGKDNQTRPKASILVSTQIVEQSVDIDTDYMISEVAPIDMLLQRMGRLWRHERNNRPVKEAAMALAFEGKTDVDEHSTAEEFERIVGKGSCCVYAPYVLWRTLRVLRQYTEKDIAIPSDLRDLIESVYADHEEESTTAANFKIELQHTCEKMSAAAKAAEARVTSLPEMHDSEDNPPTRYGSRKSIALLLVKNADFGAGKGVAVLELINGSCVRVDALKRDFELTKQLYNNIVSVPIRKGLETSIETGLVLQSHFHKSEMPLICTIDPNDGGLKKIGADEKIGLFYSYTMGVYDIIHTDGEQKFAADEDFGKSPFELGEADW